MGFILALVWGGCSTAPTLDIDTWSVSEGLAPPPGDLVLEIEGSMVSGESVVLRSAGALAYDQVYVVSNRAGLGDGLCHPRLGDGCLDLTSPIALAGNMWSDIDGVATMTVSIPDPVRTERCFQALVIRGPGGLYTELAEPVCASVCGADTDGDGICDGDDTCPGGDDRLDEDGDGVCDALDVCPMGPDVDADGDGEPDACEVDLSEVYGWWLSEDRYVYAFQSDSLVDLVTYETFCEELGAEWFVPRSAADAQLAIDTLYAYDEWHTWIISRVPTVAGSPATWGGFDVVVDSPDCGGSSADGFSAIRKWSCSMCNPEDHGPPTTRCWDSDHTYDWLLCEGALLPL
jgi:hypothetical protein